MALKYIDDSNENNSRKKSTNLLNDQRFKALFSNPDFEVDKNADEYKMLTPVLSRLQKSKVKELKRKVMETSVPSFMNADEEAKSSDDDLFSEKDENEEMESSDDDDRAWQKDLKQTYRQIRIEHKSKSSANDEDSVEHESHINTLDTSRISNNGKNIEFKVKNITTKRNK